MIQYFVILVGVAVFGLQHSGLSTPRVKDWIIDRWGKTGYAQIYKFTSVLALLGSFLSMGFWDWFYFIRSPELVQPALFLLGWGLIALGLVLAARASQVISVSTVADMRTDRKPELVTAGIYSRIRHPLYLATIILLFGMASVYPFSNVVVYALLLSAYVLVGTLLEERKLVIQYGQAYQDYREKTGFILPRLRKSEA
ncbi:MAG: methyltransferase family protein [Candidatus Thorarchaeota archaeon]